MLKRLDRQLSHLPLPLVTALSLGLIALVGIVDYLTGHSFQLDWLYLLPIALTAWFGNPWLGLVTGGAAALVWGWADWAAASVPSPWPEQIWNVLIHLATFQTLSLLISALKKQTGLLTVVAGQDYLTGLANRRTFYTEASQELSRSDRYGQIFSVAYLDVDNFKFVNDTYGHVVGDELLRQIAATLRQNTRRVDVVARLGGDEFGILLPATDANGARQTLLKLQRLILPAMAEFRWPVTFSMSVVTFSRPTSSVDELMRRVDEVMYTVKQQGQNNVIFAEWPKVKVPQPDNAADDEITLPV